MGAFDDLRAARKAEVQPQGGDEQAFYEQARANFERARPDIEAGKLRAYPDWPSAEAQLEKLRPKSGVEGAEPAAAQPSGAFAELRRRNGVAPFQRAGKPEGPVHTAPDAGMMPPSWQSPVTMTRPAVGNVQQALRDAQVHGSGPPVVPPGSDPAMPYQDQTMLAPRGVRQQLGQDLQIAARAGVELGTTAAGMGALRAARPLAGPVLKAGVSSLSAGLGSLLAEPVNPSADPRSTALTSAAFSGLGDVLALGYSSYRRARAAGAAARPETLVPGGARAMELLGEGNLPTPGRLSTSATIDTLENVAENSLLGGKRISARNEHAQARADGLVRQFVGKFSRGLSRTDVDLLARDIFEGRQKAYHAAGDALYRELDGLATEGVSTQAVVDLRNSIVREYARKAEAPDLEDLVRRIDLVLGVPESMRGIKRGVMLDPHKPIGGSPVITPGGDPSIDPLTGAQLPPAVVDPLTGATAPARPRTGGITGGAPGGSPNARATITFEELNSLRSFMAGVTRRATDMNPTVVTGQAKRVAKVADDALQVAGAALRDPEAFAAWREANRFWRATHAAFDDQAMIALANAKPDDVFNTIMQADRPQQIHQFHKMVLGGLGGSVESAAEIRKAARAVLKDPKATKAQKNLAMLRLDMAKSGEKAWLAFQGRYFARLLENANQGAHIADAGARAGRALSGEHLLTGWNAFGADANAAVFRSARQRRNAEELFRTLEITQAGTGSQTGKLAVQFGQAGSALSLILAPGLGTAANAVVMLAGPQALAKLLDNEKFIRSMVTAKRLNPGSEAYARAVTQAAIEAVKTGARVVDSNGRVIELEEDVPRAREARDLLNLSNRRGAP